MQKKRKKIKPNEIISRMLNDRIVRIATVKRSHYWFFNLYFRDYVKYETALFQRQMFSFTEKDDDQMIVIVAFRGSAKSTIMTTSCPLWAILGEQQKKFVLILSQTQDKAQQHLMNIKKELESNDLLKRDLGPFQEERNQWGVQALTIPRFNAKIATGSVGQSIRGLRHYQNRPDLIILDDIEDLDSVKTKEGRKKTYDWFNGEVIPAGDKNTKIVVVGNLLHEDCLLKRLKVQIEEQKLNGIYKEYPIMDENGDSLWPGKFPTIKEIEEEKRKVIDDAAWHREFLLKIIPDSERVVQPEWIQYYNELPSQKGNNFRYVKVGIDLATTEKDTADFTAMIGAQIHGYGKDLRIYILPEIVNIRAEFPVVIERIKNLLNHLGGGRPVSAFVESNSFQVAASQYLLSENYPVTGVVVKGDKRSRLTSVSHLIQNGTIRFPKHGAEQLIEQMVYFGVEKHEDLVDAFTLLINKVLEDSYPRRAPEIFVLSYKDTD